MDWTLGVMDDEDDGVLKGVGVWAPEEPEVDWLAGSRFDRAALEALRADPRFRMAAEAISRGLLEMNRGLDPVERWMLKDVGRTTLYLLILMTDAILPAYTVRQVCEFGVAVGAGSRGRVRAYIDFALANGQFTLDPGPRPWTQRRLRMSPAFRRPVEEAIVRVMDSLGFADDRFAAAAARLRRGSGLAATLVELGRLWTSAQRLGAPSLSEIEFFLARDGGMTVLNDLFLRQAPDRAVLLDTAPTPGESTATRFGVSRIHISRLLKDAAEAGLLRVGPDGVVFTPGLDEAFGLWSAILLRGVGRLAQAILAAEPVAHF